MTDPDPTGRDSTSRDSTSRDSTGRDSTSTGRPAQLRFTVDHWAAFWASPHPELAGRVVTPDVVGHWPDDAEPVRGVTRYRQRIARILEQVPDLRMTVAEHARNDEVLFIRWIATGTGANGPFEFSGVSRIVLRDGLIKENRVYYDPARWEQAVNGAPGADGVSRSDQASHAGQAPHPSQREESGHGGNPTG